MEVRKEDGVIDRYWSHVNEDHYDRYTAEGFEVLSPHTMWALVYAPLFDEDEEDFLT